MPDNFTQLTVHTQSRAAKRKKITYIESDSDDSGSEAESSSKPRSKPQVGRKPRKSLKQDSDDEFLIGDDDLALGVSSNLRFKLGELLLSITSHS